MIISPPWVPHSLPLTRSTSIKAMCLTDEKAIRTFMSDLWKQLILITTNPHADDLKTKTEAYLYSLRVVYTFRIPNPPIFSKIAARNMDPITGAST